MTTSSPGRKLLQKGLSRGGRTVMTTRRTRQVLCMPAWRSLRVWGLTSPCLSHEKWSRCLSLPTHPNSCALYVSLCDRHCTVVSVRSRYGLSQHVLQSCSRAREPKTYHPIGHTMSRDAVSEKAKHIVFKCLKDFGHSGASLGGSLTTWSRLGAVPEPLGRML